MRYKFTGSLDAGRNSNCSLQQDNILCVISVLVRTAKPNAFETWGIILVENVHEKCVVPCFWLLGCCNWHPAVFCVGYLTAQCIMHKARRSAQNYETPSYLTSQHPILWTWIISSEYRALQFACKCPPTPWTLLHLPQNPSLPLLISQSVPWENMSCSTAKQLG